MITQTRITLLALSLSLLAPAAFSVGLDLPLLDDTWVREDNADSNRNGDDQINARTDFDGDRNDVILLRFDISSLSEPAISSTLSLYWQRDDGSTGKTLTLWGLNDLAPNETSWLESDVTYNTAPGMIADGMIPSDEVIAGHTNDDIRDLDSSVLTALVADQDYGPQVLDAAYTFSSTALTDFLNADTNGQVTFLITRGETGDLNSSNQARFQVKEVGTGAFLDVTVPEPATFALLAGLGVLGFALWRRRR